MRDRVQLVGGDINVRSAPNLGTVIEARVPVFVCTRPVRRSPPAV
jgi:signal transduction histidine kinase